MSQQRGPSNRPMKMSELKLHRINQHIVRLREDLVRPRARVSEASASLIRYAMTTKDPLLPTVWGGLSKDEDPFYQPGSEECKCTIS